MLRYMPRYLMSFASRPWLMFSSTTETDLDVLSCGGRWRGRARGKSLTPAVYENDPLAEPDANSTPNSPEPKKKPKSPKKQGPGKRETLPTPTDVPAPTPTDVPVPEPWDVPPPDPKDPRPKSIP